MEGAVSAPFYFGNLFRIMFNLKDKIALYLRKGGLYDSKRI